MPQARDGVHAMVPREAMSAAARKLRDALLPTMRARGGYIPICDHGVLEEVPYENYLYYRRWCVELGES